MFNRAKVNKSKQSKHTSNDVIKKLELKFFKNILSNLELKYYFITSKPIYFLIKKGNFEK